MNSILVNLTMVSKLVQIIAAVIAVIIVILIIVVIAVFGPPTLGKLLIE